MKTFLALTRGRLRAWEHAELCLNTASKKLEDWLAVHPRAQIRVGAPQSLRLGLWKPWDRDTWHPTRGRSS